MGAAPMRFTRYGRTYQLVIRSAADLERALELDDSHWVATSAPVSALNCDAEFLALVDTDRNGRIRTDELRAAVSWLFERLSDRSALPESRTELLLLAVDTSTPSGRKLLDTAHYVLRSLGVQNADAIGLSQVSEFQRRLENNAINGDGIITPDVAGDGETRAFIADVAACMGAAQDRTGRQGITGEALERFIADARAYLDWTAAAGEGGVMPLGDETPAAYDAFVAVRDKVEDFYARCRMVAFDPEAAAALGASAVSACKPDPTAPLREQMAALPLAQPDAGGVLPLEERVNPSYAAALGRLRALVIEPLLETSVSELTEGQWRRVCEALAPYERWLARKPDSPVGALGREKLRHYLDGPFAASVRGMLAADREVAERQGDVLALKKLLLYHRHLFRLANNFISFPDLYDPRRRALFEMGSLVIDGRWFHFAVRVEDIKEHSRRAAASGMYVMYVELSRADESETTLVAVPATSGTVGNLGVGKRGIFHGADRRLYDARVVQIIENPISFCEALVSPFVRLAKLIQGKIEAISGSAQKELEAQVSRATEKVQHGVQTAVREAPQAVRAARASGASQGGSTSAARRDLLIGASLSVAALSSAFAYITKTVGELGPVGVGLAIGVVALVVFVPTALVAGIKLSRRDLSALLEGCGWAINARMRLDRAQRRQFTHVEPFPEEATGTPRSRLRPVLLVLLLVALIALAAVRAWQARTPDVPDRQPVSAPPPNGYNRAAP